MPRNDAGELAALEDERSQVEIVLGVEVAVAPTGSEMEAEAGGKEVLGGMRA